MHLSSWRGARARRPRRRTLLARRDAAGRERAAVDVLHGDPREVAAIANVLPFKHRIHPTGRAPGGRHVRPPRQLKVSGRPFRLSSRSRNAATVTGKLDGAAGASTQSPRGSNRTWRAACPPCEAEGEPYTQPSFPLCVSGRNPAAIRVGASEPSSSGLVDASRASTGPSTWTCIPNAESNTALHFLCACVYRGREPRTHSERLK